MATRSGSNQNSIRNEHFGDRSKSLNSAGEPTRTNRRLIANIGIVFVSILLLITFFSNTIYTFNLASVVLAHSTEGSIKRSASGTGIVNFSTTDYYYANNSGKIALLITEGDSVETGDELYTITVDPEDLKQSLEENKAAGERLAFQLEKAAADQTYAQESLAQLKVEQVDSTEVSRVDTAEFDYELERLETSAENTQKDLADLNNLYEQGAVPEKDISDKQTALDDLLRQIEQVKSRKQKAVEDHNQAVRQSSDAVQKNRERAAATYEDRKRELEKSIQDLRYQITECEQAIAANSRETEKFEAQQNANGRVTIVSDRAGVIQSRNSNFGDGSFVNKNDLILRIGAKTEGFCAVFGFPENVDYLNVGDAVTFHIRSRSLYNVSGVIRNIRIENGQLRVEVQFQADGVIGGETAEISVHHTSTLYRSLVPNNAVRVDRDGEYLLFVEMVKGLIGNEYYARKVQFRVDQQDDYNTAGSIFSMDDRLPLIVNSDKPVQEGDRVRIVGGNELVGIR